MVMLHNNPVRGASCALTSRCCRYLVHSLPGGDFSMRFVDGGNRQPSGDEPSRLPPTVGGEAKAAPAGEASRIASSKAATPTYGTAPASRVGPTTGASKGANPGREALLSPARSARRSRRLQRRQDSVRLYKELLTSSDFVAVAPPSVVASGGAGGVEVTPLASAAVLASYDTLDADGVGQFEYGVVPANRIALSSDVPALEEDGSDDSGSSGDDEDGGECGGGGEYAAVAMSAVRTPASSGEYGVAPRASFHGVAPASGALHVKIQAQHSFNSEASGHSGSTAGPAMRAQDSFSSFFDAPPLVTPHPAKRRPALDAASGSGCGAGAPPSAVDGAGAGAGAGASDGDGGDDGGGHNSVGHHQHDSDANRGGDTSDSDDDEDDGASAVAYDSGTDDMAGGPATNATTSSATQPHGSAPPKDDSATKAATPSTARPHVRIDTSQPHHGSDRVRKGSLMAARQRGMGQSLSIRMVQFEELELDATPVGGGNFGSVFKGHFRGADVAVKKLYVQVQCTQSGLTGAPVVTSLGRCVLVCVLRRMVALSKTSWRRRRCFSM